MSERDPGGDARQNSSTSSPKPENRDDVTGFDDAVDDLDDIVSGMNTFIDDSKAGPEGVEMDTITAGEVRFDVNKFIRLLNGEDLT